MRTLSAEVRTTSSFSSNHPVDELISSFEMALQVSGLNVDIRILAPMIGVRRKKDKEAEKDITKQNQPVLVGFRSAYVFDRLSRDLRPAWPAIVCRRRARDVIHAPRWQQPHHRSVR